MGRLTWSRVVKHYSPQCPHCIAAAPHYQAVYEHFVTSSPLTSSLSSPNSNPNSPSSSVSFEEFYDFHFGALDCIAFGDICFLPELKVEGYPTFNLYKNGKLWKQFPSEFDVSKESLLNWVDEQLDEIKPGSKLAPAAEDKKVEAEIKAETTEKKLETTVEKAGEVVKPANAEKLPFQDDKKYVNPHKGKSFAPKPWTGTINPDGVSTVLTAESFQRLVTTTRDPWFVKFYAPWCGHCQALAPTWNSLGREMREKLNIGEVNCDVERRLCKDVGIRGYPTIIFFQGGERVEYEGLRGFGDLVTYANKAADAGSKDVDLASYEEIEKKEEVIFLYFYDFATTSEDFASLERLTLSLIGHAPLLKTDSEHLAHKFKVTTFPTLVAIRDGRPFYYTALSPRDLRDTRKVLGWMKSVWLPIVPELSAANSREIMNGKTVILGILNRNKPEQWASSKQELKKTALEYIEMRAKAEKIERQELRDKKQIKIDEAEDKGDTRALRAAKKLKVNLSKKKEVGFAWVDAIFWDRWVRQTYGIDVQTDGERIIINDEDHKLYWDMTPDGQVISISRSQILDTLQSVLDGKSSPRAKSTAGNFQRIYVNFRDVSGGHPIAFLFFLIFASIAIYVVVKGRLRRRGPGGWGVPVWAEKDGLLGGPAAGKFD